MSYFRAVPGNTQIWNTIRGNRFFHEDARPIWKEKFRYYFSTYRLQRQFSWSWYLWPARSRFPGDPAALACLIGGNAGLDANMMNCGPWRRPNIPNGAYGGGSQSSKYIMGQCKDSAETPIGGAVVQGFRTADDLYIGETSSDDQGQYELRCPNTPTDQHYLVAYVDTGTDLAGTTVNTLVPTWRDGSV